MAYKIFLFEDNNGLVDLLQEIFRLKGDELFLFNPSQDVIGQVSTAKPDVILLDLRMEPPGKVILEQLKNDGATRDIPVLIFTATIIKPAEVKAMGAQGIINKPFSLDEIEKNIDKAISKGERSRSAAV